ncbi:MAG: helix-turn-helix domain-containing protein [Pseudomonadota bacterium]
MSNIRVSSRLAILEAAFRVLNENPTATLGEIATRAGVGRATLHRHFPGRAELLRILARTAMDELDAAVESATARAASHTDALRLSLEAMIPLANRQWFLANDPIAHDPDIAKALAVDRSLLDDTIEAARAEDAFAPDVPTKWIAECYDAVLYAAWTMVRDGDATPRQAADLAWRTLMTGIGEHQ